MQAHPHRTPWYFQACRHHRAYYSVPAVGCQASRAGRCLMALAPSIMSGNELRVTVMARNTYTNMLPHTHIHTHTHYTDSHHHSREQNTSSSDWIQSNMQMVHRRREGERGREGTERAKGRQIRMSIIYSLLVS